MGAKQLTYSDEARQKLLAGVSKLAKAVRSTLGPRGRNAVLDKGWGAPKVTKVVNRLAWLTPKMPIASARPEIITIAFIGTLFLPLTRANSLGRWPSRAML